MRVKAIILMLMASVAMLGAVPVDDNGKSPFVKIVKNLRESVVNVKTETEVVQQNNPFNDDFFKFWGQFAPQMPDQKRKQMAMGSGFVYDRDGNDVYIITNNHVVEMAKKKGSITVALADRAEYDATIVGLDPESDLALIKITVKDKEKVVVAPLGDSSDLDIGDWAIAIGNPFGQLGLDRTVTVGVISATGRHDLNFGNGSPVYQDYIQTDAAINPGNSGGPLINIKGQVIGVNAAITSPAGGNVGIGFAIPINLTKKVIGDLRNKGKVVRAYMGILPQELNDELRESMKLDDIKGVLVAKVEKDTPAEEAGVKNGDVVISINNKEITDVSKFRILVAESPVGQELPMTVWRDGKAKKLNITLEEKPGSVGKVADDKDAATLGIEVQSMDGETARRLKVSGDQGVIISSINDDSPLSDYGVQVGDVILEINRNSVNSLDDYRDQVSKLAKGDRVLLYIQTQQGGYRFLAFELK